MTQLTSQQRTQAGNSCSPVFQLVQCPR